VENWRPNPRSQALGLTIRRLGQGAFGIAEFTAGTYPACSLHGAMNKVASDAEIWRCLQCNIGCELTPHLPDHGHGQSVV
jgi:hypothetical protein